jgi:predicted RNA-binding protein with PUA-like domain
MNYWLMKSEPDTFSIDDLARARNQTTGWDGVRNFQARNFLKEMRKGDLAFFYHSSCEVPGIAGIVTIVGEAYPDRTAFDPKSEYYDPKSTPDNPRWFAVDVKLVDKFAEVISLATLREHEEGKLKGMTLLRKGNRLSVTPVTKAQWTFIESLVRRKR